MTTPESAHLAVVFLHGGVHSGSCWDETISAIRELRPGVDAFAVDIPGRRSIPGDLASLTYDACVDSLSDQIREHVGPDDATQVVLVGHSLAGVVIPGVVHRLGAHRFHHIIFVACCVPSAGHSVLQSLSFPLNRVANHIVETNSIVTMPRALERYLFANRTTKAQRAAIHSGLCAETPAILTSAATERLPRSVRKSWILTMRDRALSPRLQRRFIQRVGGVHALVQIDAGHEVMFTHPRELAEHVAQLAYGDLDLSGRGGESAPRRADTPDA